MKLTDVFSVTDVIGALPYRGTAEESEQDSEDEQRDPEELACDARDNLPEDAASRLPETNEDPAIEPQSADTSREPNEEQAVVSPPVEQGGGRPNRSRRRPDHFGDNVYDRE